MEKNSALNEKYFIKCFEKDDMHWFSGTETDSRAL